MKKMQLKQMLMLLVCVCVLTLGASGGTQNNAVSQKTDPTLIDTVHGYWVNFVKTGSPNDDSRVNWPLYNNSEKQILQLGSVQKPITDPDAQDIAFVKGLLWNH